MFLTCDYILSWGFVSASPASPRVFMCNVLSWEVGFKEI